LLSDCDTTPTRIAVLPGLLTFPSFQCLHGRNRPTIATGTCRSQALLGDEFYTEPWLREAKFDALEIDPSTAESLPVFQKVPFALQRPHRLEVISCARRLQVQPGICAGDPAPFSNRQP